MNLVITIDTEEDDWGSFRPSGQSLTNIERIPHLQEIFDKFNAKPAYLVTYPVATNDKSVSILRGISDRGGCEIGTHCHPWNTPPFDSSVKENCERGSMLCNLPEELQYQKIKSLHETIEKNLGVTPVSFRAGRWGYNEKVAAHLLRLNYKVDTSITPFIDWRDNFGLDFSEMSPMAYRFSAGNIFEPSAGGRLLEVPATIGFFQKNFALSNTVLKLLQKKPFGSMHAVGIMSKLKLINLVWLSPEFSDCAQMAGLAARMQKNGHPIVNMFFHSSCLKAGTMPHVRNEDDEKKMLKNITEFLRFARDEGIESIMLRDSVRLL